MLWAFIFLLALHPVISEKGYDPDTLEALRLDIVRVEGRIGAVVKNDIGKVQAKLNTFEVALNNISDTLSQLVNISGGEAGFGKATGVDERPSPDLKPLLDKLANLMLGMKESMIKAEAVKMDKIVGWGDPKYWYTWWELSWSQPLAIFFLGWASYQCERSTHKLVFYGLGLFFSPHLGLFVLILGLGWSIVQTWRKTKRAVERSPLGRCCCPRVDEEAPEDETARPRLVSARQVDPLDQSVFPMRGEGEGEITFSERPLGFFEYIRGLVNPYSYMPVGTRASVTSW